MSVSITHNGADASSSGLHAGSAQWQPPVPSMAALPVDMSKTEPKPAYYKLQFGDDYTGFSYYVRTLGIVIGRKCEKPIQVPPPDITSPQVPARPPLDADESMAEGAGGMLDPAQLGDMLSAEELGDIPLDLFPGVSLPENSGLDTPSVTGQAPSVSPSLPPLDGLVSPGGVMEIGQPVFGVPQQAIGGAEMSLADMQQVLTAEHPSFYANGLPDGEYNLDHDLDVASDAAMIHFMLSGSDAPPPPPPPPRSASSVEHVDVDLGPLKSVSRNHAKIDFRPELGHFCLEIQGRNGAWVDDRYYVKGSAVPLYQGSVIQIATRIFSFILPPTPGGSPGTPHVLDASFDSNSPLDDVPYPYNLPASQVGYQEFFGESATSTPGAGPGPTTISQVPQPFNAFTAQDGQGLGLGMEYDWSQDKRKGRHHWTEEWSSEDSEDSWDSWDESDEVEERKIHRRGRRERGADEGESELSSLEDGSDEDEDDEMEEEDGEEEVDAESEPEVVKDEPMPEVVQQKKRGRPKAPSVTQPPAPPPQPQTQPQPVPVPIVVKDEEEPIPSPAPIRIGKGPAKSGKLPAKSVKAVKALKAQVVKKKMSSGEDVVMAEQSGSAEDGAEAKKAKKVKAEKAEKVDKPEPTVEAKLPEFGPKEKPKPPPKKPAPKKVKPAPNPAAPPRPPPVPGVLIPGLSVQQTPPPPRPPATLAAAMAASAPPPRPPPAPAPTPAPAPAPVVRPPLPLPPPAPRPPPVRAVPPVPVAPAVRPPVAVPIRPPPPPPIIRPPPPPAPVAIPPTPPRPVPVQAISAQSTAASSPGGTPEPQKPFFLTELIETPGRPGHIIVNVPIPPSGAGPRPPPGPLIGLDGEEFIGPPPIKPTATFAIIIYSALANLPRGRGTLGEVCNWIAGEWEWFRLNVDTGWQNSIRHNLSLNKAFLKVPRIPEDDPESKGSVWIIDPKEGPIFEEKQRKEAQKSEGKTRTAEMRAVRERQKIDERSRMQKEGLIPTPSAAPAAASTPALQPRPAPARVAVPTVRPTPRPPAAPPVPKGPVLPKGKVTVSFDTITPAMRTDSLIQTMDSNGNPLPFVCNATALVLERSAFGHLTPDIIEKLHMLGAHTAVEVLLSWVNNKNKQQLAKAAQAKAAQASASSSAASARPVIRPSMAAKQARPPARPPAATPAARPPVHPAPARPPLASNASASSSTSATQTAPAARPPAPASAARPPAAAGAPAKVAPVLGPAPPGATMTKIITLIASVAANKGDVKTVGQHAVALLRYIKQVGAAIDLKAAERIWATGIVPPLNKPAGGAVGNGVRPGMNGANGMVRKPGMPGAQGQTLAPKGQLRPPAPASSAGTRTPTPTARTVGLPSPQPQPVVRPPPPAAAAVMNGGGVVGAGGMPGLKRKLEDSQGSAQNPINLTPGAGIASEAKRPKLEAGGS